MATVIEMETPIATTETLNTSTPPKPKKHKAPRGSGYTPAKDTAMAKAWIAVSENPIVGAQQKGNDFFISIAKLNNEKLKPNNREMCTVESVKARCKAIHKDFMLFAECYAQMVRSKPTGVSPDDIIHMATGLLNGMDMGAVVDDCGKPFRFLQAWYVLREHEKFMSALNILPKSNNQDNDVRSDVGGRSDDDGLVRSDAQQADKLSSSGGGGGRPVGRKRAKEQLQKQKEASKKLKLAAESVAAQVERNVVLKRHFEIALFTSAPAGCDDSESLEYFRIMRSRALNAIRREEKATDSEAPDNGETKASEENEVALVN